MIKIYKSKSVLTIYRNGAPNIVFNQNMEGSSLITGDKDVQDFIEGLSVFGRTIWLHEAIDEAAEAAVPTKALTPVEEVKNCADAKVWLQKHGAKSGFSSREALKQTAEAMGYEFVNL